MPPRPKAKYLSRALERISDTQIEIDIGPFEIPDCPTVVNWSARIVKGSGHVKPYDEEAKVESYANAHSQGQFLVKVLEFEQATWAVPIVLDQPNITRIGKNGAFEPTIYIEPILKIEFQFDVSELILKVK